MKKDNNQPEKWNLRYFSPNGEKYLGAMTMIEGCIIFRSKILFNRSSFSFKINSDEISSLCEKSGIIKKEIIISVNEKKHIFTSNSFRMRKVIDRIKQLTRENSNY